MANKDLIKRAFSVTANLPTSPQPSTISELAPATVQREALSGENSPSVPSSADETLPVSEAPAPQPALAMRKPKTGPGAMMTFLADQSEVYEEATQLRSRLNEFTDASAAKRLDPKQIRTSKWANRDDASFATPAFERLKQEIASAGGNVQAIKVRPLLASEGAEVPRWEIVFGHRRHRACLELNLPVLALIQHEMNDAQLFVEMERENREREDLSAWEQGMMYLRALEMGLFPSAKQLALAIDSDLGNIGRAMALAKLPADVVQAFGSPLHLQFRYATPLKNAHQRDPEGLLAAARALMAQPTKLGPKQVFAALTKAPTTEAAGLDPMIWRDNKDRRMAAMSLDRKGKVTLAFDAPMDESKYLKLAKLIDGFLGLSR